MAIDTSIKKVYNQTDLSVIPEGWETQSLEGIADPKASICYGIVQVGSFASNGIPVLAIKNLNTDYFTNVHRSSPAIEALYARSRVCPGDILISVKGTIGRIGIVPQHFVGNISRDLARLRLTERDVPEFWFQMLQSESAQRRLGLATVGTTRMELSIGILKQIRMLCPPKVEQCAIARVLNDMDALITSLDKLITKKRDIKQATMQQLLTGKTRLAGFSGKWKVQILGEIAEIIDPHPSHRAPAESNNGIPFVGIGDISTDGKINHQTARIVDEMIFEQHNERYRLDDGLIGIGRVASIGKVVRLLSNMGKFVVSPTIAVIKPKKIDIDFLFYYLTSKEAKEQFDRISNGSTRQSVGMNVLRDIQLFIPKSLLEQTAIAAILSDMDAEIAALEQRRDKTRALKQGMMQELLTGKTRLMAP